MKRRVFALLLAAMAMASVCAAQNDGVQKVIYAQYGFDFALPQGYVKMPVPVQAPEGWVEVFSNGALAAGVGVGTPPKGQSPATAADEMARKMGLARTSFTTPQGVEFTGASGTITLNKDMAKSLPPSLPFRPGMTVKMSLYMTRLPSDANRALIMYFGGPGERSSQVDSLAQIVLNSVNFTGLKPGRSTGAAQAQTDGLALVSGQIALYGKVRSVKAETKCLTMLADRVTAYGQKPVALDPPRQKIVKYSELPGGVMVGSRVLVIGKNAGTGKPMNADVIRLETAAAPPK
jgi:hypothetical protein